MCCDRGQSEKQLLLWRVDCESRPTVCTTYILGRYSELFRNARDGIDSMSFENL